jgi:hypothetical protein
MAGHHADAELGDLVAQAEMRHAGQFERVVEDAEHRIAPEVDRVDVLHQRDLADDVFEAQPQVFGVEGEEMPPQGLAVGLGQLQDGHGLHGGHSHASYVVRALAQVKPTPACFGTTT